MLTVDGSIRVSNIDSFSIQAIDCVRCRLIDGVKPGVTFFVLKQDFISNSDSEALAMGGAIDFGCPCIFLSYIFDPCILYLLICEDMARKVRLVSAT